MHYKQTPTCSIVVSLSLSESFDTPSQRYGELSELSRVIKKKRENIYCRRNKPLLFKIRRFCNFFFFFFLSILFRKKKNPHLYTDRLQQRGVTDRSFTYARDKNVHSYDKDFPCIHKHQSSDIRPLLITRDNYKFKPFKHVESKYTKQTIYIIKVTVTCIAQNDLLQYQV